MKGEILPCTLESVKKIEDYAKREPVVIPTDTLYGLSMSIYGEVRKIFLLKRRDPTKRIPVGVSDIGMMEEIAHLSDEARILVTRFMPGALTLVLRSKIPEITGDTVGVRIPNHFVPIELARRIGPITLTSANVSGERNPVRLEDTFSVDVRYRIDCGELSGKPSTIVSLVDGINLIREGAIPFSAILKALE